MNHRLAVVATSALVLLCALELSNAGGVRDLTVGTCRPTDRLLKQELVERSFYPLLTRSEVVTVTVDENTRITCVEVIDVKDSEDNADAAITRGGPNDTFVAVKFESQRSHGIHYLIKVYGV